MGYCSAVLAIGVTEYGGPEALRELDLEPEPLGPGQVRLRVRAAAVNPTDTGRRAGLRSQSGRPEGPEVPGMDVAGEVVEVGPETETDLAVGDRVMGIVVPQGEHGGYRSDLVLPAASVVTVPHWLSDAEAASLPMNALTARLALELMALEPGQVLAVTGAAGAFGGYLVELATDRVVHVVADASEDDEDLVRSLGADEVVRRGDDVVDRILALHPDGVDALADGSVQGEPLLRAVRPGGRVTTVRGWQPDEPGEVEVHPVWVREVAERQDWLREISDLVERGALTPRVAATYPATEAAEAHRRLEAGGVRGRLVLEF